MTELYARFASDPAYDGAAAATVLNAACHADAGDLARASDLLRRRQTAVTLIRSQFTSFEDLYLATDADFLSVADAIAAGTPAVEAVKRLRLRPGCAVGIPVDWDMIAPRCADAVRHPERIAIVPAGSVSDVLAVDRDRDEQGELHYWEYTNEVLARVAFDDGREAVLLPPLIFAARGYRAERPIAEVDLPGSLFLEFDGALLPEGTILRIEEEAGIPVARDRDDARARKAGRRIIAMNATPSGIGQTSGLGAVIR